MMRDVASSIRVPLCGAVALLALGVLASCSSGDDSAPHIVLGETESEFRGALLTRDIEMPDAALVDTKGRPFDLRRETEGFVTLLYVGYTHCPDICPTHMSEIAAALKQVPQQDRARVKVLFITSDPERDTPEALGEWLANFDPSFLGLTGTPDELNALQQDLGMNVATREDTEHGDYEVSHASYVLAFAPGDRSAKLAYPSGMTSEDYRQDLIKLAASSDSR